MKKWILLILCWPLITQASSFQPYVQLGLGMQYYQQGYLPHGESNPEDWPPTPHKTKPAFYAAIGLMKSNQAWSYGAGFEAFINQLPFNQSYNHLGMEVLRISYAISPNYQFTIFAGGILAFHSNLAYGRFYGFSLERGHWGLKYSFGQPDEEDGLKSPPDRREGNAQGLAFFYRW